MDGGSGDGRGQRCRVSQGHVPFGSSSDSPATLLLSLVLPEKSAGPGSLAERRGGHWEVAENRTHSGCGRGGSGSLWGEGLSGAEESGPAVEEARPLHDRDMSSGLDLPSNLILPLQPVQAGCLVRGLT